MSIYGRFACIDCKIHLSLGKAIYRTPRVPENRILYFHLGGQNQPINTQSIDNAALWKLLADHAGHRLRALVEDSTDYDLLIADPETRRIGGDSSHDIPFEDYLQDWPGLLPPSSAPLPSSSHELLRLPHPSFLAFERTLLRASLQLSSQPQGLITLLVPCPLPASSWLSRFLQRRRPASLDRYRHLSLRILHEAHLPLYEGPLASPSPSSSSPAPWLPPTPSSYAHLFCHNCHVMLFLGSASLDDAGRPLFFLRGNNPPLPNHHQQLLSRALWKLLADHAEHELSVLVSDDPRYAHTLAEAGTCEIGSDGPSDLSFEDYLHNWPG